MPKSAASARTSPSKRQPRSTAQTTTAPRSRPLPSQPDPHAAAAAIADWFILSARDLPWRTNLGATSTAAQSASRTACAASDHPAPLRDPYWALVSEAMLQQTQVSRVIEKFQAFIARFPTVSSLAAASEDDVLQMWSGLGYYRRARLLHAAAKLIVERFDGRVPHDPADLRALPGVGDYTAGAVASIAFNQPAPLVDGNVARVMMRLHARPGPPDDRETLRWLWDQARALVSDPAAEARARSPRPAPALVNEGLMELGATVCVPAPAAPMCDRCPLKDMCLARKLGRQLDIPAPKARAARRTVFCAAIIVLSPANQLLMHQRPSAGMWARLWQTPTLERDDRAPGADELADVLKLPSSRLRTVESFEFLATHRRMLFDVWCARAPKSYRPAFGRFISIDDAQTLSLSSPQKTILAHAARLDAESE